jgi:isopenicillin-N epimerase
MTDHRRSEDWKPHFLLESDVHFLNHGCFGACPRSVFEEYQRIQLELERQPVRFLGREFRERMAGARTTLAAYLGADAEDLTYVPNATIGLNIVARSLNLQPGDEVLSTDHEYGAIDRMWSFVCGQVGAHYVRAPISVPIVSTEDVVEQIWSQVTERTRVLFLSHITSFTALILPIEPLIAKAREAGILTVIDGAQAPGVIPLDLDALGADAYSGNCHKWMMAPKGSGFLHVRRDVQHLIDPLVVSWGWESDEPSGSRFVDHHEWQGTRDISAFLSVPAAIRFMEEHDWPTVAKQCSNLLRDFIPRILAATGQAALSPATSDWYTQMASFAVPTENCQGLKTQLYDEYKIEAPVFRWNNQTFLRISVNAYNTAEDLNCVVDALKSLFLS